MENKRLDKAQGDSLIRVRSLSVGNTCSYQRILDNVAFDLSPGEILGIVGESGSGKTTLGLALLNHCKAGLNITGGSVEIDGVDITHLDQAGLRRVRGRAVSYVPQDPSMALNPALRIGTQLAETIDPAHSDISIEELLTEVMLPTRPEFLDAFPHQLSGGQIQRAAIAMAFANRPQLIVMDEPTTGLDVSTQAHILESIKTLCRRHKVAIVYISHDMAVVATLAQRTAVVYAGRIIELGPTPDVMQRPSHPYTRALIRAVPNLGDTHPPTGIEGRAPNGAGAPDHCCFAPRCSLTIDRCREELPEQVAIAPSHVVRCFRRNDRERLETRVPTVAARTNGIAGPLLQCRNVVAFHGNAQILHDISFEVAPGECLGVVGSSGSGKTTLARSIGGLHDRVAGEIMYRGMPLPIRPTLRDEATLQSIQYVFQNPYGSLNPRRTIRASIMIAAKRFGRVSAGELQNRLKSVLDQVSLASTTADLFPHQLSGGQRQRAAIARALIVGPNLLICDEITSALDVSVQARIVELLTSLQQDTGTSLIFVSHNLALVQSISQKLLVLERGRVVESGATPKVLNSPESTVVAQLLADTPSFSRPSTFTAGARPLEQQ